MNEEIKEACARVWEELKTERFNQRLEHIRRIFEYDRFLGIDVKNAKRNPLYWNDQFDKLMDMKLEELEKLEIEMHLHVEQYGKIIISRQITV